MRQMGAYIYIAIYIYLYIYWFKKPIKNFLDNIKNIEKVSLDLSQLSNLKESFRVFKKSQPESRHYSFGIQESWKDICFFPKLYFFSKILFKEKPNWKCYTVAGNGLWQITQSNITKFLGQPILKFLDY